MDFEGASVSAIAPLLIITGLSVLEDGAEFVLLSYRNKT